MIAGHALHSLGLEPWFKDRHIADRKAGVRWGVCILEPQHVNSTQHREGLAVSVVVFVGPHSQTVNNQEEETTVSSLLCLFFKTVFLYGALVVL